MATPAQRSRLVALMDALIAERAEIHYAQIRPMRTIHLTRPAYPMTMDCSEAVTCLCKWAGLKDPNGLHYNGSGYTGTMLDHLPHYHNPANANAGALVVFGPGTGEHVGMVLEPDHRNPLLFSHGSEAGPVAIRLHDEAQYHAPPVTFLSIAAL
jgi:hypothetical protein